MHSIRLFGGASIEGPEGAVTGRAARRHALALLALLAASPTRSMPRDRLIAYLWPESDAAQARRQLNVIVYELRKVLGQDALLPVVDELRLDLDLVDADVVRFEAALDGDDLEAAVELCAGPFVDGLFLRGAPELEQWIELQRARYALAYRKALEGLAEAAEADGRARAAIEWWRRLATEDPLSSRVVLRLMRLLDLTGDRGQAIELARVHTVLFRDAFGAEPDPAVAQLAERLSSSPAARPDALHPESPRTGEAASPPQEPRAGDAEEPPAMDVPIALEGAAASDRPRPGFRSRLPPLRSAAAVALAVAGLGLAAALIRTEPASSPSAAELSRRRVVAAPFENRTGDPALDPLGLMAADWVAQELARTGLVDLVPAITALRSALHLESGGGLTRGPALARTLAEETGAGILVSGAFYRQGDSLFFQAQITDVRTGELLRGMDRTSGSVADPIRAIERLRHETIGALATLLDPRLASWARTASLPPSFEAYQLWADGMERFFEREHLAAASAFEQAAAIDTAFTVPLIWAVFSYRTLDDFASADSLIRFLDRRRDRLPAWDRAMLDYHAAYNRGDWQSAYRAMQNVQTLAPGSEWLFNLGQMALRLNRPGEAREILERLDPERGWMRDWPNYWGLLTEAQHQLGDHAAELATARRALALLPDMGRLRWQEIRALAALGRTEEAIARARQYVAAGPPAYGIAGLAFEFRAHGQPEAARRLLQDGLAASHFSAATATPELREHRALLLYAAGRWEESAALYAELLRERPDDLDLLGRVGTLAARTGDRKSALHAARSILGAVRPYGFGRHALWRARIAALLGEREQAVALLRQAIDEGLPFGRSPDSFHIDPDLDALRGSRGFQDLVRAND